MPYRSAKQRAYMHAQHPEIAARWDKKYGGKLVPKKKVSKGKEDWTKAVIAGTAAGALANQFPRIQDLEIKRKRRRKGKIEKVLVPSSDDPDFNHVAAQKAFDLVMKMDDDTAEMFTFVVASDMFEETIEKNLDSIQAALNRVFAQRSELVKKALVKAARDTRDPQAVEYAKAYERLEEFTKAPHTPQYYGYQWKESDFRRDPSTGRFQVKVHHTMTKPLKEKQAKAVIGSYGPKDLDDKQRARYQDEYRQVASFLSGVQSIGQQGNVDVVYHLRDAAGNRFSAVNNSGTPPSKIMDDPDVSLVAMEAKPTTLSVGGAAYGLAGAMGTTLTGEQVARANLAAEQFPGFAEGWSTAGREQEQTSRTFNRLQTTGAFLNQAGAPGSRVQLAGKFAEVVGQYGPEAERVIGPTARKTAYRYRGTEKAPDKQLVSTYGREIQDAKRYGVEPEEADQRLLGFGTKREQMRGDFLPLGTRRPTGARERRPAAVEGPAVGQMGRSESALAEREPSWGERGAGAAIVADYLRRKLPDKHLYRLHLAAGNTPPSEGVIINDQGQLAVQAVGYGDDHYLPFNLKNLKALKGGEYVRNRSVGGLTSEDVYTGLMSGARRVTVVSRSGTFTMEFNEDFRGGRRHNDKARRMTRRYEQILDAVQSGKVDRQQIPKRWRDAIEQEVRDDLGDVPRSVIREEREARVKEFKENPEIDGRDEDRAEAMISQFEARAALGDVPERDVAQFRREIYNELHNMKEVRFRLNGIGYEAALNSLQEQFPYYIKSVKTNPTKDEELLEFEMDEGYVEPGRNRPTKARAGLYGTKENPGEKFTASWADYQRGRTGQGGFKAPAQTQAAQAERPEPERPPSTEEARRREELKRKDAFAQEAKIRSARKATMELRKVAVAGQPNFQGEDPPVWWTMEDPEFKEWVSRPDNATAFHSYMEKQSKEWAQPGGLPGFGSAWVNYEAARGMASQVKFQMQNAGHFPAIPYSFVDDKRDAYHAGARASVIAAEQRRIDTDEPLFTSRKKLSQLTDEEMEDEIERTQFLRSQVQGSNVRDVLAANAEQYKDAPPADRLKVVLSSEKRMDTHLENIHRQRYLNEMMKVAKTPAAKPGEQKGGSSGGSSGGSTGGLPSTPTQPRPTTEPGGKATTTEVTINARNERMKGARDAVLRLDKDSQDQSLTQAQRNQAHKDKVAIASFGQWLKEHPNITDPIEIDKEMDKKLNDNQKQFIAGLFG